MAKNRTFKPGSISHTVTARDIGLLASRLCGRAEQDAEWYATLLTPYDAPGAWQRLEKAGLYRNHAVSELGRACVNAWRDKRVFEAGAKLHWLEK